MSNKDPDATCENCVHFEKEQPRTCRKYAPRGKSKWTIVSKQDWCSEFEKFEENPLPVGTI